MKKYAVIALSGGLDSCSLLLNLLSKNYSVTALSFNYGQKHLVEVRMAKKIVRFLSKKFSIKHKIVDISSLSSILDSSLTTEESIPEGHYEKDNMISTVVPNRNKIFLSILQAAALSKLKKVEQKITIAMGVHAGDISTYPDTRLDFIKKDYNAFLSGNWNSKNVIYYMPYINMKKLMF